MCVVHAHVCITNSAHCSKFTLILSVCVCLCVRQIRGTVCVCEIYQGDSVCEREREREKENDQRNSYFEAFSTMASSELTRLIRSHFALVQPTN